MFRVIIFIFLFFAVSCSTSQRSLEIREYSSALPLRELRKRGLKTFNANYKSRYYEHLPYLYFNGNRDFKKVLGDFYSLKHPKHKEVNLGAGFWDSWRELKNVLVVYIWIVSYDKISAENAEVSVESSKFGIFSLTSDEKDPYRFGPRKELFYAKKFTFKKPSDIVKILSDDAITIVVDGYRYVMLSPEFELD